MSMNVLMKTRTAARMSSISVSTLVVPTSVNVNKTCTLSMENAEVITEGLIYDNDQQLDPLYRRYRLC